ncbi:hypothetical protein AMTR_s00002p00241090 [Amborella trichopoda]|uniref:Uncharacterized protein n=1 Tax=Amborella trichopoda TaxID=13333 RepID=W1P0T2_AMBTC|nr:hypothetical protein AMTR_s00002p00241090 [Amborella trichopoda]
MFGLEKPPSPSKSGTEGSFPSPKEQTSLPILCSDEEPSNVPMTLFLASTSYIPPLLVTRSYNSSLGELSPHSRNWKPSKEEKRKVVREKAGELISAMSVKSKGTFKKVEEVLDDEDVEWPSFLKKPRV